MSTLRLLLLSAFLLGVLRTEAQQSGWDLIRANDFNAARIAFEGACQLNPQDEAALTGLLFLAETRQDVPRYQEYANRLLRSNGWQPHYVWLFDHLFTGEPAEALTKPLPISLRLPFMAWHADTLEHYRRFAERDALNRRMTHDWRWAIAGAFTNVGGSAYAETTPVETRPFNLTDTFRNEEGQRFAWLKVQRQRPGAQVSFGNLPSKNELGLYYANTFLTVPSARQVALRLNCGEPVKIWLDDQLLFARPDLAPPLLWDNETIMFHLPAGQHRLVVKVAEFPEESGTSRVGLAFFDEPDDDDFVDETDDDSAVYDKDRTGGKAGFVLRLTDPVTGELFTDIGSAFEGTYTPATAAWTVTVAADQYLQFFREKAAKATTPGPEHYLLVKAFFKQKKPEAGEAFFAPWAKRHPKSAYANYLLAKFYAAANEADRAEALLSSMDTTRTPTLAERYLRLEEINPGQEEERYVGMLEKMLALSPTNWKVLERYLDFLQKKGRKGPLQDFAKQFLSKNNTPVWRERLETYTEADSYKPESSKPETDKERDKRFRAAQKRLQKTFDTDDYDVLITHYKRKEQVSDVLRTFDEMLNVLPYATGYHFRKARYLFEKDRSKEALELLLRQLEWEPYDDDLLEMIGDIYIEQKRDSLALLWYRRAEQINSSAYRLNNKIEKLANKPRLMNWFKAVDLEKIARDTTWRSQYPDAEAVIGFFGQQAFFSPDEKRLTTRRKMALYIRNDAGAKQWTEANLRQMGSISSAKVLKRDGTVTSPDLNYSTAVFKNLQAGDLILLEGNSSEEMPDDIPGELFDIGTVSWSAPVVHANLEILLPKAQVFHIACHRLDCATPTQRDTGDFKILHWNWRNIPKAEGEEAAPGNLDGLAWYMLGSAPDWQRVVQWYTRLTYRRTEPNYELLEQARALLRPGMREADIVATLHTFITKDINYSYVSFLNSSYVPKKPGATLAGKIGDCKDVATVMITLLREQGIQAWYTLVSTHSFSNREPRPTLYVFNHAIVAYQLQDGVLRFADLTTDYFPTGVLPEGDSDAWGLVIRPGETQLRRLPNDAMNPAVSRIDLTGTAALDADRNLVLQTTMQRHGVAAGNWREAMLRATEEERRKKVTEYLGGGVLNHIDLTRLKVLNLDSLNAALQVQLDVKAYNPLDKVANLFIMPLPLPHSTPTHKTLFAPRRYNDLDLDALFELSPVRETIDFALPAGLALAEIPANLQLDTPFGEYRLTFEPRDGGLRINRSVTFRQRFIPYTDFAAFKTFYLAMLEADDVKLALKR
jgi:tetratricopeptide (TPR) repeat protein